MSKSKDRLRKKTRSAYDVQDFRMRIGGRIVTNFRAKLGLDEEDVEEKSDKIKVLQILDDRYDRITDGIAIDDISRRRSFEYDGVISNYFELTMYAQYRRQCNLEEEMFKDISREIEQFDIWNEFLVDVSGIGPRMASVIISEFNPHKGKYVSSFWKYAGLDTVETWHRIDKEDTTVSQPPSDAEFSEDRKYATKGDKEWRKIRIARSRRREHLRDIEYEDSNGETQTRKGLTFNPFLHDKLLGVLGPCLIRANGKYKEIYDNYRERLDNEPKHKPKSDAHKHRMGIRYMIKELVKHLYNAWRPIEGLPVHDPYAEAKLDGEPHGDSA